MGSVSMQRSLPQLGCGFLDSRAPHEARPASPNARSTAIVRRPASNKPEVDDEAVARADARVRDVDRVAPASRPGLVDQAVAGNLATASKAAPNRLPERVDSPTSRHTFIAGVTGHVACGRRTPMGMGGNLAKMLLVAMLLVAAQFMPSLAHAHVGHVNPQATPIATVAPAPVRDLDLGLTDAVGASSSDSRRGAFVAAPSLDDETSSGRCGMPCCNGTGVSCCPGALLPTIAAEPCVGHADQPLIVVFGQLPAGFEPTGLQRPPRAPAAA